VLRSKELSVRLEMGVTSKGMDCDGLEGMRRTIARGKRKAFAFITGL
jgi:hypothetical protein